MNLIKISNLVELKFKEYCVQNDIQVENISENVRLIGSTSVLDSIELVSFIVELEEIIEEEMEVEIQLSDERAMSRTTSPFISLKTMSEYIYEILNE